MLFASVGACSFPYSPILKLQVSQRTSLYSQVDLKIDADMGFCVVTFKNTMLYMTSVNPQLFFIVLV